MENLEKELALGIEYLKFRSVRADKIKRKNLLSYCYVISMHDVLGILELVQGGGLTEFLAEQKRILGDLDTFVNPDPKFL